MKIILIISCLLSTVVLADVFTINGKRIEIPTPDGFVRVTDQMEAVQRVVEQMDDPMNDMLAYYVEKSDVPAALAGEIPGLDRTFVLKINKDVRRMTIGKSQFAELKKSIMTQNEKLFREVNAKIPAHMKKVSRGISEEFDIDFAMSVSEMVPFEPHYEVENAFAYSMYVNYGVSAGDDSHEEVVAGTATFVNASGVLLFLYGYASQDDLKWTRSASQDWVESVMSSNIEPPKRSSGGGTLDWGRILQKGLIGAAAGGLLALLAGALKGKR